MSKMSRLRFHTQLALPGAASEPAKLLALIGILSTTARGALHLWQQELQQAGLAPTFDDAVKQLRYLYTLPDEAGTISSRLAKTRMEADDDVKSYQDPFLTVLANATDG